MLDRILVKPFVLWVLLISALAFFFPEMFTWFKSYITAGLGVIMLGMGLTLSSDDFRRVVKRFRAVVIGVGAQFLIMPSVAFLLAALFHFDPSLSAGMIVVGSCPGGTASNVIAYLAGADVALSVTLTSITTLLSVFLTPFFIWLYAGTFVEIDTLALFLTILQVIVGPIITGVLIHKYFQRLSSKIIPYFPSLSVGTIIMIVACVVGLNKGQIFSTGGIVIFAVALHNGIGYGLGYWLSKLFKLNEQEARTIAIEVGMQNSGLGVALAVKHFANAAVALPPAIFSVWHNISGPALASWWRNKKAD
jgi:bile acid:Na+ symporter, BASS family